MHHIALFSSSPVSPYLFIFPLLILFDVREPACSLDEGQHILCLGVLLCSLLMTSNYFAQSKVN